MVFSNISSSDIKDVCIGQPEVKDAPAILFLSVIWERYYYRYRHSRAYRTVLVDLSESAHNYILLASSLNLGTFITPALNEEKAAKLLGENPKKEQILYAIGIG